MNSIVARINVRAAITVLLDHGANPTIEDNEGILPVEHFKDSEPFDPTSVFLLVRSMIPSGV